MDNLSLNVSKPLFSVIITVLNGADTLLGLFNSLENQLFTNYELILVDGGSTDGTLELFNQAQIENKKIVVEPGCGIYKGLNTGVFHSTGEWLYFIGADDKLFDNTTLQDIAASINSLNRPIQVLVSSVFCEKQNETLRPMLGSPYLFRHQVHHQGVFYKRNVFDKLHYDENRRIASDYELNLTLALNASPHLLISIVTCSFGGDGISENQLSLRNLEIEQIHSKLFTGLTKHWIRLIFSIRTNTGALLRRKKLLRIRSVLKRIFG